MIETDGGKTLIAEDKEEAVWYEQAEQAGEYIKQLQRSIKKAESELKMSAREIEKKFKAGARANIEQNKMIIKIQKEFKKFCESKITKR